MLCFNKQKTKKHLSNMYTIYSFFRLLHISQFLNHLPLSTLEMQSHTTLNPFTLNASLKPFFPYPVHQHKNVGIFSGFSSIFTSQKNCDLCEHIICFFGLLFYSQPHEIHNTDLLFYTLTKIEIWSESWASGEKKNRQQSEASCCSVL